MAGRRGSRPCGLVDPRRARGTQARAVRQLGARPGRRGPRSPGFADVSGWPARMSVGHGGIPWRGGLMDTHAALPAEAQRYIDEVHTRLRAEADKPLFVAVMG